MTQLAQREKPTAVLFQAPESGVLSPEDDGAFRRDLDRKALNLRRLTLLVGVAVYAAFGLLDRMALTDTLWKPFWLFRFAFVCPLGLVIYLLAHVKRLNNVLQPMLFAYLVLAGAGMAGMYRVVPEAVSPYYATGTLLVIVAAHSLYRFRFYWASVSGWGILAIFNLVVLHARVVTFDILIWNVLFATTNLFGMTVSWMMEHLARIEFAQSSTLDESRKEAEEVESDLKERLREKVQAYRKQVAQLESLLRERQEREETLKEEEGHLRGMLDGVSDICLETDLSGGLFYFNPAFCVALGREKVEVQDTRLSDWLDEKGRFALEDAMVDLAKKTGSTTLNIRAIRSDGTSMPLRLSLSTRKDFHQDVAGFRIVGRETEGVERRMKERRTPSQWSPGDVARLTFLSGMSYEIRTAMTGILGAVHLLSESGLRSGDQQLVETIRDATDRMVHVMGDVQDFVRIQEGSFTLDTGRFDLKDLVGRIAERFEQRPNRECVEMVWDTGLLDGCGPWIGDVERIRQAIFHLVENAVKFTEEGEIRITFKSGTSANGCETIDVKVVDTGIGIAEERIRRLLESPVENRAEDAGFGGPGLGLALARLLAEIMGGKLEIRSLEGAGTTVMARFEVERVGTRDEVRRPTVKPEIIRQAGGERRILLVEDNTINQQIAVRLLQPLGCHTVVVENGQDAISLLGKESFHLVLMDLQMPVMDGIETTRRLREGEAGERAREIPVVALTAHVEDADREACLGVGMNDFMTKPLKPELLRSMVDKWSRVS